MGALIIDGGTMRQAGLAPNKKLAEYLNEPLTNACTLKFDIRKQLRILDEQNAVNIFQWYNLPCDITSQDLERLLYYRGQLCLFYSKADDNFYFMPYAGQGGIDFYGRWNYIHPVPIAASADVKEKAQIEAQKEILGKLKLRVVYGIDDKYKGDDDYAVILFDRTMQYSNQTVVPRVSIQEPLLDVMAECFPLCRTALYNCTGTTGMRVASSDATHETGQLSQSIQEGALRGDKFIPIRGNLEFQELVGGNSGNIQDFLLTMQSMDNYRLSLYGMDAGGIFEKKAHMLEAEEQGNASRGHTVIQDGLARRQHFCDVINWLWDLGTSCEVSQAVQENIDEGMYPSEDIDQSGAIPGDQPEEVSDDRNT